MNPETVKEIVKALEPVAAKLGQGAEHLYALAVRQAYVDGYKSLALVVLAVIYVVVYTWALVHAIRSDKDWVELLLWGGGIGLVVVIGGLAVLGRAINALGNPEWYAIQSILSAVR